MEWHFPLIAYTVWMLSGVALKWKIRRSTFRIGYPLFIPIFEMYFYVFIEIHVDIVHPLLGGECHVESYYILCTNLVK